MSKPSGAVNPNLLLVEGTTDAIVANHLASWHGIRDFYDSRSSEGIEHLLRVLPERLKESERRRVAVVVDADKSAESRWQAVQACLTPLGYGVPPQPEPGGCVIEPPDETLPRVGIWVMPNNSSPGVLEDFLQELIVSTDPLLPLARKSVAAIPTEYRLFPEPHRPKADIYTWLAWQQNPGSSFGPAIKAGLLDGTQPRAEEFIEWLLRVFGD